MNAAEFFEGALHWLQQGEKRRAIACLEQGLLLAPDNASAWANRGNLLSEFGQYFEAWVSLNRALALAPKSPELYVNISAALAAMNRHDDGLLAVEEALRLDPKNGLALANKGNFCYLFGRYDEAVEFYRRAIDGGFVAGKDRDEMHLFCGMALLAAGRFEEGWTEYETGRCPIEFSRRNLSIPEWGGQDAESILVVNEQGHGDALQFMRLAALLKRRTGAKVYLEVRQPLLRIARTMPGIDGVIAFGDPMPKVDAIVSSMSLPYLLSLHTEADFPSEPYLSAKGSRAEYWRELLVRNFSPNRYLVGLCWAGQGRPDLRLQEVDARRSMSLAQLAPIAHVPNVGFVSLQVGSTAAQALNPPTGMLLANWTSELDDFYDTAALIECLDLVITVDTSVAHLAGALGKETWLLSRFDNCWRWLGDREDSPWYPTLRQFKQASWGNWAAVADRAARELKDRVAIKQVA